MYNQTSIYVFKYRFPKNVFSRQKIYNKCTHTCTVLLLPLKCSCTGCAQLLRRDLFKLRYTMTEWEPNRALQVKVAAATNYACTRINMYKRFKICTFKWLYCLLTHDSFEDLRSENLSCNFIFTVSKTKLLSRRLNLIRISMFASTILLLSQANDRTLIRVSYETEFKRNV